MSNQNSTKTNEITPKKYSVELTEEQIALIKAGLQYWFLADDYGNATYHTIQGASSGSSNWIYANRISQLYGELNKQTRVKPNYGYWGRIKRIGKLYEDYYKKSKKEGEDIWKIMDKDSETQIALQNELKRHGLDKKEIVDKVLEICGVGLELKKRSEKHMKDCA